MTCDHNFLKINDKFIRIKINSRPYLYSKDKMPILVYEVFRVLRVGHNSVEPVYVCEQVYVSDKFNKILTSPFECRVLDEVLKKERVPLDWTAELVLDK